MSTPHDPPIYRMAAVEEPPAMEWWREAMTKSTETEALRLREHAIGNLANFPDNRWGPFVAEAEAILRQRGIAF